MNTTTHSVEKEIPEESNDAVLLTFWFFVLFIALLCPFCRNERQRKLCRRRIQERRWIEDEIINEDDWYYARYLRRQEERRLEEMENYRINRKQQDDIREQYLVLLMRNYSMILSSSNIHGSDVSNDQSPCPSSLDEGSCAVAAPADVPSPFQEVGEQEGDIESVLICNAENNDNDSANVSPNHDNVENDEILLETDENEVALEEVAIDGVHDWVSVPPAGCAMMMIPVTDDGPPPVPTEMTNSIMPPPIPNQRLVPSGCAICLSQFKVEEKISWSSNSDCPHVFHQDCLLKWFQAVGLKDQTKQLRIHPNMGGKEALELICRFPKLCPCCRQPFCSEIEEAILRKSPASVTEEVEDIEDPSPTNTMIEATN